MATWLQKAAGTAGKIGSGILNAAPGYKQAAQVLAPNLTLFSSLQNYGGNTQSQPFTLVPAVHASGADYQGNIAPPINNQSTNPYAGSYSSQNYANKTPTVLGAGTGGGDGGGNGSGPNGQDVINQNASGQDDVINRDYEDTMAMLGGQEQQMLGQSAEASGTLSNEATQVTNQLANQQTVDTQGQEQQLAQGESTAASGLQGARDTFRQIQQNNIAQLSGAGLSSSSVAEALAEKLGVETARRIAGITGSLGEIRQNATKEIARIKSYYEGKATEVTQWVANEKLKITNALNAGLNQINQGRQQAATAKATARQSLLADVRSQLFTLAQQETQFQQSLKAWATQKAASTEKLITDPSSVLAYNQNINKLNAQPGITQTNIGNYGVDDKGQTGYYAGPLNSVKKDDQDVIDSNGDGIPDYLQG